MAEAARLVATITAPLDPDSSDAPEVLHWPGSAAFSPDGLLVWAHVIGPLADDTDTEDEQELWMVLDAANGGVLGYAETETVASGSVHTPYPDPARMGLSVGEGEEDSPALSGWWNGEELSVEPIGAERILLDVSPNGLKLLTVPLGQWSLTLHDAGNGSVQQDLEAAGTLPPPPTNANGGRVFWDYEAAFIDDGTIIAGTAESDAPYGTTRHWVVDARTMTLRGEVVYPSPISGRPRSAGGGMWYTVTKDATAVHLWRLSGRASA